MSNDRSAAAANSLEAHPKSKSRPHKSESAGRWQARESFLPPLVCRAEKNTCDAGTSYFLTRASTNKGLRAITRWFIARGILGQFSLARLQAFESSIPHIQQTAGLSGLEIGCFRWIFQMRIWSVRAFWQFSWPGMFSNRTSHLLHTRSFPFLESQGVFSLDKCTWHLEQRCNLVYLNFRSVVLAAFPCVTCIPPGGSFSLAVHSDCCFTLDLVYVRRVLPDSFYLSFMRIFYAYFLNSECFLTIKKCSRTGGCIIRYLQLFSRAMHQTLY